MLSNSCVTGKRPENMAWGGENVSVSTRGGQNKNGKTLTKQSALRLGQVVVKNCSFAEVSLESSLDLRWTLETEVSRFFHFFASDVEDSAAENAETIVESRVRKVLMEAWHDVLESSQGHMLTRGEKLEITTKKLNEASLKESSGVEFLWSKYRIK